MTLTAAQVRTVIGEQAVDSFGDKAGKVSELFTSNATGEPEWVTLKHGLFGGKENFAPLAGATVSPSGELVLATSVDTIRDAPGIDNDGQLTPDEITRLYSHYALTLEGLAGSAGIPSALSLQRYVITEQTATTQVTKDPI